MNAKTGAHTRWAQGCIGSVLLAGAALGMCPTAAAHDNPLPSATVVQREAGHVVLTLRLDAARALHRTLEPQSTPLEALASMSALEPSRFAERWAQATGRWTRDVSLIVAGRSVAASRWVWPSAAQAQAHLRQQLMPQLTGGHPEHELLQAQAEFRWDGAIGGSIGGAMSGERDREIDRDVGQAIKGPPLLKLSASLRPLTVTTLRPRQQWSGNGEAPIPLRF